MPMETTSKNQSHTIPTLIIRPPKKWVPVDFHELWEYRELLYSFVSRDVKIRYKQTALGFLWAIIQPLFMMVILPCSSGDLQRFPRMAFPIPFSALPHSFPGRSFLKGSPVRQQAW